MINSQLNPAAISHKSKLASSTAMANPLPKPATIFSILREVITLPKKNPKLILSLFLISFLRSFLLSYAFQLSTYSLFADFIETSYSISTGDGTSPDKNHLYAAYLQDAKALLSLALAYNIIAWATGFALTTLNVCALAVTHAGKLLALRDLLVWAKSALGRAVFTQLVVSLLNGGYVTLLAVVVWLLWFTAGGSVVSLGFVALAAAGGVTWYCYLSSLWSFSTVVSVMEEGRCGIGAISRAAEILVRGSRWRGVAIIFISSVVAVPISVVSNLNLLVFWARFSVPNTVYSLVLELVNFVVLAAFVVLYYDCKRRHGGDGSAPPDVAEKGGYSRLPAVEVDANGCEGYVVEK